MSQKQALQQLKAKLERGAAQAIRGELLGGDKVFEELRKLIQQRGCVQKKCSRR